MIILRSMGGARYAMKESGIGGLEEYCNKTGLQIKSIVEAWKLNEQLIYLLNTNVPSLDLDSAFEIILPTPIQVCLINN